MKIDDIISAITRESILDIIVERHIDQGGDDSLIIYVDPREIAQTIAYNSSGRPSVQRKIYVRAIFAVVEILNDLHVDGLIERANNELPHYGQSELADTSSLDDIGNKYLYSLAPDSLERLTRDLNLDEDAINEAYDHEVLDNMLRSITKENCVNALWTCNNNFLYLHTKSAFFIAERIFNMCKFGCSAELYDVYIKKRCR